MKLTSVTFVHPVARPGKGSASDMFLSAARDGLELDLQDDGRLFIRSAFIGSAAGSVVVPESNIAFGVVGPPDGQAASTPPGKAAQK